MRVQEMRVKEDLSAEELVAYTHWLLAKDVLRIQDEDGTVRSARVATVDFVQKAVLMKVIA